MLHIHEFMTELAQTRPIYHSEADFQHAFAWQLHQWFPDAAIRLEYPLELDRWIYVDLVVLNGNHTMAIELKYKTRRFDAHVNGEPFHLKNHSAANINRYAVLKDVERMERAVHQGFADSGWMVLLTNDQAYWTPPARQGNQDADFHIHEGRQVTGHLMWKEGSRLGQSDDYGHPIQLGRMYTCQWQPYSTVADEHFHYLALQIT